METSNSFGDLLELSIRAELIMRDAYRVLAEKFAPYPEVARFWDGMAKEEIVHIRELEQLRERSGAESLREPADMGMVLAAQKVAHYPLDAELAQVMDLEDAFELVADLENSETNAIFEFIMKHFITEPQALEFVLAQLRGHLKRLMDFSAQFGTVEQRRLLTVAD